MTDPHSDLDALRQQYLQCLNALALELPIAVHTDATGIISVYVRALLARLDAKQQELDNWKASTAHAMYDADERDALTAKADGLQQRLDAVTAYATHTRDCESLLGTNELAGVCSCGLAAVLTGDSKKQESQLIGTGKWFAERLDPKKKGYIQIFGPVTEAEARTQVAVWASERSDLNPHCWERLIPNPAAVLTGRPAHA